MLKITPVRAFADNYLWMLWRPDQPAAAVVDPGDAKPVMDFLRKHRLTLTAILLTHHHRDHSGGIADLLESWPQARVYGSHRSQIPSVNHRVGEGSALRLPELGLELRVWEVPGHTLDHLAFWNDEALFCGDWLFSAGCGRVFEGTFEQMWQSLARTRALPGNLALYAAHEYTLDNLGFAQWVEPDNAAIVTYTRRVQEWDESDRPSLPSCLALERTVNPFLRVAEPQVRQQAGRHARRELHAEADIFTALRQWKDREYD